MIATSTRPEQRDPLALPGAESPVPAGPAPGRPPWTPLHIAAEKCKGCSLCIGACEKHALALDMDRVNALGYHPIMLVDQGACTSCALCARVCPDCVLTVFARPKPRPATADGVAGAASAVAGTVAGGPR